MKYLNAIKDIYILFKNLCISNILNLNYYTYNVIKNNFKTEEILFFADEHVAKIIQKHQCKYLCIIQAFVKKKIQQQFTNSKQ